MSDERTHSEHVDRVWELIGKGRIAMLVTWDGERQRARPMAAMPDREAHAIYFLTDLSGAKDDQIEQFPIVTLTFADQRHNTYVAVTGRATVSNDRARIRELWSPFVKAWWDSPDDPGLRMLKVAPDDAEYWDSPGGPVAEVKMLAAAVTGGKPELGVNARVDL